MRLQLRGKRAGFRKIANQERWIFCERNKEFDGTRKIVEFWLYFQLYVSSKCTQKAV